MTLDDLNLELTDEQREILVRNDFDADAFARLRDDYLAGRMNARTNRVTGAVTLPQEGDVVSMDESRRDELEALGVEAIEAGELGMLILNGGMATRFGGVVKGTVEVFEGLSFLSLKIRDAARWGGQVPVILMNSFATDEATAAHLEEHDHFGVDPSLVDSFCQNVSLRIAPDGELWRGEGGDVSLYGPGHGDLTYALNRGALQRFIDRGGKYLWMSNVDNILATCDPAMLGAHIEASRERGVSMTVEAAPLYPGDKGGMPARVDDDLQIVEHFRFPEDFDHSSIPVFNTNTFVFDAAALAQDFDLTWFVVEKSVEGRPAIQFERLCGELSAFLETQFLAIERDGDASRFLPIKKPEDLEQARSLLERVMRSRGVIA